MIDCRCRIVRSWSILVVMIGIVGVGTAQVPNELRQWQDVSGAYSVQAKFVEVRGDEVVLRTADGRTIPVPIDRLCERDRQFIQSQRPPVVGTRYDQPGKLTMRIGMEATAQNGSCNNLVATFPLPLDWPEQRVKILNEDISPSVERVTKKTLNDGVEQVEFRVPRLSDGETAYVIYTVEIERFRILPPPDTSAFVIPKTIDADLRRNFMGESPFIETGHPTVKRAADGIQLDASKTAWEQVETIYDWSRSKVKHDGTKPLKGALQALTSGTGDCEEITSLFIAMCRLKGIPARSVWIERHTYPEFYLEDRAGQGYWFPCQSLGTRSFGGITHYELLWQKGDKFRMSQKPGLQRYVTPTISGTIGPGGGQPVLREIREVLEDGSDQTLSTEGDRSP